MQLSEYIRDLVNLLAAHGDLTVVREVEDHQFDDVDGPKVQLLRKVDHRLTPNWVGEEFPDLYAEHVDKEDFLKRPGHKLVVL